MKQENNERKGIENKAEMTIKSEENELSYQSPTIMKEEKKKSTKKKKTS